MTSAFTRVDSNPTTSPPPSIAATTDDNHEFPLIPVRMLNEFTYCPRLGYLEWVQGEWAENIETLEGTFGHRNVDRESHKPVPTGDEAKANADDEGEAESIHARSLMLSAPQEGIVAKLDVLELEGASATPVDYKRGKVPDIPEGAYEPERVQLCAQGLILRENGFDCREGVIYYIASKRRLTIPFTDVLISRTREQIREFRATARAQICPPPLDDSPKCPRCSLVGICLPDETNLLIHLDDATDGNSETGIERGRKDAVRKLLPARHDALPLYIQQQGAFVGKTGDRITVKLKGEELANVRLLDISQVCVFGNVMFSAPALKELTCRGVPICHYSYGGWFHSLTTGLVHKNVELRIRQFAVAGNPTESLQIARQLIAGKIKNSRTMLRRHLENRGDRVLDQLAEYAKRALVAESAETLLGLEGMAAKEYFAGFFTLLSGQQEFDVNGRNRRPPRDPVNAVLSFVYSLLTKEVTVVLNAVGFDPMLGFLHKPRYGRPSLALDLAEEFRPIIADSVTLMAFNNGEVNTGDFIQRAGAVVMTEAGRRSILAGFERRLQTEITHPIFGYKVSHRRILEVQARLLARYIQGEIHEYPSFCTR